MLCYLVAFGFKRRDVFILERLIGQKCGYACECIIILVWFPRRKKVSISKYFKSVKSLDEGFFQQCVQSDLCLVCFSELMVMLVPPAVPVLQGEPVALRCVVWGGPKLEKAVFYKYKTEIKRSSEDTYTITNPTQSDDGNYSCHATYRFSHISAEAAEKEGDSDAQELKVIGKHNNSRITSHSH